MQNNILQNNVEGKEMSTSSLYSLIQRKEDAHDDPIYCCAWARTVASESEGAKDFMVTGGLDCLVKVWIYSDSKLELLHTLEGHTMSIVSVAVSSDGHTLASSSIDSTLVIWEVMSGIKVHTVETGATDVWKVSFSPDGRAVATGTHSGKVMIYGVESGKKDRTLDTRGKFTCCVAWSPNGKYLASGSVDGAVCIFDVSLGKLIHAVEAHAATVRSLHFAPNSQFLLTASNDGFLKVFSVTSGTHQLTIPGHKSWVLDCRYSAGGKQIVSSGADGSVRVHTHEGRQMHVFEEHRDAVWGVDFNQNGRLIVSVSKDKCINIYKCG